MIISPILKNSLSRQDWTLALSSPRWADHQPAGGKGILSEAWCNDASLISHSKKIARPGNRKQYLMSTVKCLNQIHRKPQPRLDGLNAVRMSCDRKFDFVPQLGNLKRTLDRSSKATWLPVAGMCFCTLTHVRCGLILHPHRTRPRSMRAFIREFGEARCRRHMHWRIDAKRVEMNSFLVRRASLTTLICWWKCFSVA